MIKRASLLVLSVTVVWLIGTTCSAEVINLTGGFVSGTATAAIGGVYGATSFDPHSTGTGVIDPFLRLGTGNDKTIEEGFNTSNNPELQAKASIFTHALLLSNVPIFHNPTGIPAGDYYEFLLDINQNTGQAGANLLDLNQIQIFQSPVDPTNGNFSFSPFTTTDAHIIAFNTVLGMTEVFRMSTTGTNDVINLNFDLNPGSGWGDMFLYVRTSAFTVSGSVDPYVVFYSQFGAPPAGSATPNDGFEEWATRQSTFTTTTTQTVIPEPTTILLLGAGLVGVGLLARKRSKR